MDSKYRSKYQTLLINPLLKSPFIQRLNPIGISLCSLIAGLMIPTFLGMQCPLFAICFLVVSGFLDTLDGSLARSLSTDSNRGAAIDITFDRIVEIAIILGLFLVEPKVRGLYCLLMLASILICITTFLVVGIFTANGSKKSFYYSPGIIERTEAFLFFAAMILFPKAFVLLSVLFSLLVTLTGLMRLCQFARDSV